MSEAEAGDVAEAPKKKRKRGKGGGEAERIVKAWLELQGWVVHRAAATGFHRFQKKDGSTGFGVQSHDLFGCFDLLSFKRAESVSGPDGIGLMDPETWALQVTVPDMVAARRNKIDATGFKFPMMWRVSVIAHESRRLGRGSVHFLRIYDQNARKDWREREPIQIDMAAIKARMALTARRRKK